MKTRTLPNVTAIEAASGEYRASEDVVGRYIGEETREDWDAMTSKHDLYRKFIIWAENVGEYDASKQSQRWFSTRLRLLGYVFGGQGRKFIRNVKLNGAIQGRLSA